MYLPLLVLEKNREVFFLPTYQYRYARYTSSSTWQRWSNATATKALPSGDVGDYGFVNLPGAMEKVWLSQMMMGTERRDVTEHGA